MTKEETLENTPTVDITTKRTDKRAETHTCDYIDRQAAIDRINKQREHLEPNIFPQDKIGDAAYRICAEFIERLPSAQQWIPVSSGKLPENSFTLVLVQISKKSPDVELAFYDYNRECWENARHYQKISDVVAWCELPDPWKGGAEECH